MKKLFLLLFLFFSIAAIAQDTDPDKDENAQKRAFNGSFSTIIISDGIDLILTQGNEETITVSATDQKYLPQLKTEVENGILKIYLKSHSIKWVKSERTKLKAYISFKTLEKLVCSSGVVVIVKSKLDLADLEMNFTSGSVFTGELNAKQLSVEQSSGAVINISGKAEKIIIKLSSGANFKGFELAVNYCDAIASSGAGVKITVNKELNAKASSGAGIHYKGEALIRDLNVSSGGIVKHEQ